MENNITVIIRSVGERTEKTCKFLLDQEVGQENVFVVHEAPFSKALRKSFEIGIEQGNKWTLCTDADVLIKKGGLKSFIDFANQLPDSTFKIYPFFVDKLFNIYRDGGLHLYRTSLLAQAIELIPEEGVDLRPESHVYLKMKELGYEVIGAPFLLAIHDYQQYHRDIFRKCYIHAHKWVDWMPHFIKYWREKSKLDKDFQVALWGLSSGISKVDNIRINKDLVPYEDFLRYSNGGLAEKNELEPSELVIDEINSIIGSFQEEFDEDTNVRYLDKKNHTGDIEHSISWKIVYVFADFIERIGKKIKRIITR